jgi:hypothetical protein
MLNEPLEGLHPLLLSAHKRTVTYLINRATHKWGTLKGKKS